MVKIKVRIVPTPTYKKVFLKPVQIIWFLNTNSYPTKLKSTGHKITRPAVTALPDEKELDTT